MNETTQNLLEQIDKTSVPRHIAIIMDGNGRWAQKKGLQRIKGHYNGAKIIRHLTDIASELGVKHLTLYCFSTENWRRPLEEVNFLMDLIRNYLIEQANDMVKEGVRLTTIGDTSTLPDKVKAELIRVKEMTKDCSKITLNLALNYGGRDEIVHAVNALVADVKAGKRDGDITEEIFEQYLYTNFLPDPDLLIRTSGEIRLSNFLPWQTAYTEFYFTDVNWPDFTDDEFYKAILEYQHRHRRFGGIS
ncbi:MAG: isoprenyl transferase [Firmicutes bacterium]|nr:isoprenyl transferase [Bacillota bacterium]